MDYKVKILTATGLKNPDEKLELDKDLADYFEGVQKVHEISKKEGNKRERFYAICKELECCEDCNLHHIIDFSYIIKEGKEDDVKELLMQVYDDLWDHINYIRDILTVCCIVSLDENLDINKVTMVMFSDEYEEMEYTVREIDVTDYYADFLLNKSKELLK